MIRTAVPTADQLAAVTRLKGWTRDRFALGDDLVVFVAEVACGLPGCPPLETVVAFWTAPGIRHQFKVFKPVAAVATDDLPPAWMKNAIIADDAAGYDCC